MTALTELRKQLCASGVESTIRSWDDLASVATATLPVPVVKAWVEEETGLTRFTRLLESTAETNLDLGILRPRDYDAARPKVWFLAG